MTTPNRTHDLDILFQLQLVGLRGLKDSIVHSRDWTSIALDTYAVTTGSLTDLCTRLDCEDIEAMATRQGKGLPFIQLIIRW